MACNRERNKPDWLDDSSDSNFSYATFSSNDLHTPSSRIGSALKGWCERDTKIRFKAPRESIRREPVFSARLGKEPRIQRTPSVESLETHLSLLTCSMKNTALQDERIRRRSRKRRQKKATETEEAQKPAIGNPWLVFAQKKTGFLERLMVNQNAQMGVNYNIDQSHMFQVSGVQSAYDLMDENERQMLYKSAFNYGTKSIGVLKKSGSVTDMSYKELDSKQDSLLAVAKSIYQGHSPHLNSSLKKRSRERRNSDTQLGKDIHIRSAECQKQRKIGSGTDERQFSDQIKERVRTTTLALRSMSNMDGSHGTINSAKQTKNGVNNSARRISKSREHGIRISQELSQVISQDIVRRMGVPRHHVIKRTDLATLDKNHRLDRRHRNLKVFNWLHSLNEEEFQIILDPHIDDRPPGRDLVLPVEAMHIEACDDPDEKPFYERAVKKFVHRVQQNAVVTQS